MRRSRKKDTRGGEEEEKESDEEVSLVPTSTTDLALKNLDVSDESMDDESASDPSSHSAEQSPQSSQETSDDECSNDDDDDTAPAPASSKGAEINAAAGAALAIPAQRANSHFPWAFRNYLQCSKHIQTFFFQVA